MLRQEAVAMTVLAQDPDVGDDEGPVVVQISVPADRLQRGPRNHRFHVVDTEVGAKNVHAPVRLHADDPWTYVDKWADATPAVRTALASDREFRAQNVFAIASHTLALFERHLGRPAPWQSGWPHLYLLPQAKLQANAAYSRKHAGVLFGWLPAVGDLPAVYTSLSYDVIAHEVTHAILDGLRPKYTEPGLPDQLAFHEALADLVALFSVFELKGVAQRLLDPDGVGPMTFESDTAASAIADRDAQAEARRRGRADYLKRTPLAGLAEQLGRRKSRHRPGAGDGGATPTALRRSVEMTPGEEWKTDPRFNESHRRAEVLVAAFMQTFVTIWAGRLEPLRAEGGMDTGRVAEEGTKSARHLLGMLLRSLDYLPPVELEFADVIDSVITADKRLAPDDDHDYRGALTSAFASFGIVAPGHRILDEDGIAAPKADLSVKGKKDIGTAPSTPEPLMADYPPDADAQVQHLGIRYEHINLAAFRTSAEEVYQFIWNNSSLLGIDVRLSTKVERVLASTRVGADGLVVNEVLAEYTQRLRTTAGNLPPGMHRPEGMDPTVSVELWGGGVLVFDQFGRFRLHQRKPILDIDRQDRRLAYLFERGLRDRDGGYGVGDGVPESERFALLHEDSDEEAW